MKKIIIILFLCYSLGDFINAKEHITTKDCQIALNIEKVDSIIIRTLEWHVTAFGYLGFNRKAFDKTYDYILENQNVKKTTSIYCIKIKDKLSLSLLIAILNYLQPSTEQKPTPNEIMAKSEDFTPDNYVMVGYAKNEDPIEVRGQIKVYFKDQSVKVGYISPTSLDYNNIRYLSAPLSEFIYNFCGTLGQGHIK